MVPDRDRPNLPKEADESTKTNNANFSGADRINLLQVHLPRSVEISAAASLPRMDITSAGREGERQLAQVKPSVESSARVISFYHLQHSSGDHNGADALVRLPRGFDPKKPINLVVYNHGFGSNVKSSFNEAKLNEQMASAPANTILIMPEWQTSPGARSAAQGQFQKAGNFKGMLQEIFDKTPELKGKSLSDVKSIDIVSHSAGYAPSMTEIYNNGLAGKIKSVTLLDSLYNGKGFDRWIKDNIHDLSDGKKHFNNIFNPGGTAAASKQQAERVKNMLSESGLPDSTMLVDYKRPNQMLGADQFRNHSIVFKASSVTDGNKGAHMSLPNLYLSNVEKASGKGQENGGTEKKPLTTIHSPASQTEGDKKPETPINTSATLREAQKKLEAPDSSLKEKMQAMASLYEQSPKDNKGMAHVTLNDAGKAREFEISRQSFSNNVSITQMFARDSQGQAHPVLRGVERNGNIEHQQHLGQQANYKGEWWSNHEKESNVANFKNSAGTEQLHKPGELPKGNTCDSTKPDLPSKRASTTDSLGSLLANQTRSSIGTSKYKALDGNTPARTEGCASTVTNLIYEAARKAGIELPYKTIHNNQVKGMQAIFKSGVLEKNGITSQQVDRTQVQPGDILLAINRKGGFGTSPGSNHTGVVTRVENGQIYVANNHAGIVKEDKIEARFAGYNDLSFMRLNMFVNSKAMPKTDEPMRKQPSEISSVQRNTDKPKMQIDTAPDSNPEHKREKIEAALSSQQTREIQAITHMPGIKPDVNQVVVVTSPRWNSVNAVMNKYERVGDRWQPAGKSVPVEVGRNGMGWGTGLSDAPVGISGPKRSEESGEAPAGVFNLESAFGTGLPEAAGLNNLQLPYKQMTDKHRWVDDPKSPDYNKLVLDPNAHGEKMNIAAYKLGIVVGDNRRIDPNTKQMRSIPGKGSAIFLHVGSINGKGTSGCTKMTTEHLRELINWMKPGAVMVQAPADQLEVLTHFAAVNR